MSRGSELVEHEALRNAPRFREGAGYSMAVFAVLRVVMSIVAVLFVSTHADPTLSDAGAPPARYKQSASPGLHNAIDGMQRWDAAWFEWIAAEGYGSGDARAAFFPGYPLLVRATRLITSFDVGVSATIVSNAAFALSLIVFYALTSFELGGSAAARRAVLLLACLPASFFFMAPLSEAPFLLASLLGFFWARTGRWGWRVAAASFAACSVRSVGVAVVAGLVVEAMAQQRRDGRPVVSRVTAAAAGLLAPAMYLAWWWLRGDGPLQPLRAQASWQREVAFPFTTVGRGLRDAFDAVVSGTGLFLVVDAGLLLLAVCGGVFLLQRRCVGYAVFVWASLLIPLSYPAPWRPLLSIARFTAVLFPAAWAAQERAKGNIALFVVAATLLTSELALAVVFMDWGWIY